MSDLFCFGLGYSASVIARRLAAKGWRVSGTSRNDDGLGAITSAGYAGFRFDGNAASEAVTDALGRATHILLSIPPDEHGDPALRLHGDDIAASTSVSWIGYFSTIGVYGDAEGGWVDETTPPNPGSFRGRRRLDAEIAWRDVAVRSSKSAAIFRLPGIYGPGRSTLDDVRRGTARRLIKPGQVFNRAHVDDIATAVIAAMAKTDASGLFNITDDLPSPPQDVVAFAAELLGAPVPPDIDFATATLSEMGRSFYSESKRVRNDRMKRELGVELAFPTYREGLSAIARQDAGENQRA